jgi:hypothetical protein
MVIARVFGMTVDYIRANGPGGEFWRWRSSPQPSRC